MPCRINDGWSAILDRSSPGLCRATAGCSCHERSRRIGTALTLERWRRAHYYAHAANGKEQQPWAKRVAPELKRWT